MSSLSERGSEIGKFKEDSCIGFDAIDATELAYPVRIHGG